MKPTQIHLSETEFALLDAESARTGASRGELIRRAIKAAYGPAPEPTHTPSWVGIVSDGSFDAEKIDEELAEIFEERYRSWH
jgi:hypothetical protein